MIRLTRETTVPEVLTKNGPSATEFLCARHDAEGEKFRTRSKDFPSTIYSHATVKEALARCQNGKCCYSEMKFPLDYPEVEHFRPKGFVNKGETKARNPWGYYWLAHEWDNLLLCKAKVNRRYKRNFFPLEDEATRVTKYGGDLSDEKPVLVNPFKEDPREHIQFHRDEPFGVTERGRVSIRRFGLRDEGLAEDRRDRLAFLMGFQEAIAALRRLDPNEPTIASLEAGLVEAVQPKSEFSSMAMDLTGFTPAG